MTNKPLTVIVTPISVNCNLRCVYCFHSKEQKEKSFIQEKMPLETLEKIIEQTSTISRQVRLIWHGGEPLLSGISFFEKIIEIQNRYPETSFFNSLQTNGTLLNPQWTEFFQRHNFNVGVSIDGPQEIHNKQRVFISGKGSFSKVFKNATLIHGKNSKNGVLCVVTRNSLGHEKEIFNFLALNFKKFDLLPYYEVDLSARETSKLVLLPEEFAQFMINIFNMWFELDDPNIRPRYLQEALNGILGLPISLCSLQGSCSQYISINHNGDVYPCDRFGADKEFQYGNVHTSTLKDILDGKRHLEFHNHSTSLSSDCQKCKWLHMCNGDCTYFRYLGNGKFSDKSYYCMANKEIFRHIEKRTKDTLNQKEITHDNDFKRQANSKISETNQRKS